MNLQQEPDRNALCGEQVSALCDDRLCDQELDELLARCGADDTDQARWHGYQLIGEVLRGHRDAVPSVAPSAFLEALHAKLAAEPRPVVQSVVPVRVGRPEAANEAVFRWKLVSGLAGVVAVAAIGWNVLGGFGSQGTTGGALLVQAVPASPSTGGTQPAPIPLADARPVVVSTPQGRVIRDAALERMLAEHRQHGGMSAFQSSTGFIRNATYDADAR